MKIPFVYSLCLCLKLPHKTNSEHAYSNGGKSKWMFYNVSLNFSWKSAKRNYLAWLLCCACSTLLSNSISFKLSKDNNNRNGQSIFPWRWLIERDRFRFSFLRALTVCLFLGKSLLLFLQSDVIVLTKMKIKLQLNLAGRKIMQEIRTLKRFIHSDHSKTSLF